MSDRPPVDPILLHKSPAPENPGQNTHKAKLADHVQGMPQRSRIRKPKETIKDLDQAKYKLVGRKVVCLGHPFGSPRTAVSIGLKIDAGREADLQDASDMTESERMRHYRFYEAILTHSPGFDDDLNARMELEELTNICAWITTGMSEQRSTDLGALKHEGLKFFSAVQGPLNPPLNEGQDKSKRGFNHPQIARCLCPRKKLDTFDEDPEFMMDALKDGKFNTSAGNWPTCFYEEGVYDPQNKLKGLFRNHAALRFYMYLFIGPSAARTDTSSNFSNSSRPAKNRGWGLTEVTPQIIAYVHVILYFTLSTAPRWTSQVGQMDLDEMASIIIEMFEEKDSWTRETLAWWNSKAFTKVRPKYEDADSDDDVTQIRAQRGVPSRLKVKHLSRSERRAAEGREFATPPPEEPEAQEANTSVTSAPSSALFDAPGPGDHTSDLSSCPSDDDLYGRQAPSAIKTATRLAALADISSLSGRLGVPGPLPQAPTAMQTGTTVSTSNTSAQQMSDITPTSNTTEVSTQNGATTTGKNKRKAHATASSTTAKRTRRTKGNGF